MIFPAQFEIGSTTCTTFKIAPRSAPKSRRTLRECLEGTSVVRHMEDFQVILNSIEAFLEGIPTAVDGLPSDETHKVTHLALSKLVSSPPVELCNILEEARCRMENILQSDLPRDGVGILQAVHKHVSALACKQYCDSAARHIRHPYLVKTEADTVVGVSWGLLSPFPVLTFSPVARRWLAWADVEHTTVTARTELNEEYFRRVDVAELATATAIDIEAVLLEDTRAFFAVDFVAAEVGTENIVHELVVAVGGGFFAVLARDTSTATKAETYLFRAVSRLCMCKKGKNGTHRNARTAWRMCKKRTCCKFRDVVAQVRAGGYLTFVSYLVLRTFQKDLPDFSSGSLAESQGRGSITAAATAYVLAARRLWSTERVLQILCREICLDTNQERFVQELTTLSPAERVFTGSVHTGYGAMASIELSTHITELEQKALKESALIVLMTVHSLVLDGKFKRVSIDHNERMMWPTFLHQLHMEGNVEAAIGLAEHMSESM